MENDLVRCPICGRYAVPSEDHIPPKSCNNFSKVTFFNYTIDYLGEIIDKKTYRPKDKFSQNGLKLRHCCEHCNNTMGLYYDTELKKLYDYMISKLNNVSSLFVGDITKIVLSVVGHFLAASDYVDLRIDNDMRMAYSNPTMHLAEFANKYSLFFGFYPYKKHIAISRSFYTPIINNEMSIMYFFPMAFVLCTKRDMLWGMSDMLNLLIGKAVILDGNTKQWQHTNGVPMHPFYPLNLDETGMVLFSHQTHANNTVLATVHN